MFDPKLKEALGRVQKPGRYTGGEPGSVYKDKEKMDVRFAFCFPDTYEVGMSFLGEKILYELLNSHANWWCERAFMPWLDMKAEMERLGLPLYTMESKDPLTAFDAVGFTLQYELSYTNILAMLDLAHIPFYAKDRDESWPLIVAGGPCACNSEPIADFFDVIQLGEGENQLPGICAEIEKAKKEGGVSKQELLRRIAKIPGIYIPAFYDVAYQEDGRVKSITPNEPDIPAVITKAIIKDLNEFAPPTNFVVPMVGAIQDRASIEVLRGCVRGCRFCQAGMIYRPIRPRKLDFLKQRAIEMLDNTGYEEITLSSLSSSDYDELADLVYYLIEECRQRKLNIALPSLRIDAFSLDVMSKVQDIRKSSLTFAPEAGSQRMRDVINKGLTKDVILKGAWEAFQGGWKRVKLYFMLGLPGETDEDIAAIAELANDIAATYFELPKEERQGRPEITASTSFFVPKPFTPFQWAPMGTAEYFDEKRRFLTGKVREQINQRSIRYICHDAVTSELEGIFARGDRKLSDVIEKAYKKGCIFDAWTDYFRPDVWNELLDELSVDRDFYNYRERNEDEIFPWDFIDIGVSKQFLRREYENAKQGKVTPNCKQKCSGCGAASFHAGICMMDRKASGGSAQ